MSFLVLLVAGIQLFGIIFFLYTRFWWLDMVAHFLGGAFIGLSAIWLYFFSGYIGKPERSTKFNYIWISLGVTLVVAISWEVYEYILGPFFTYENYARDTSTDVLLGMTGAFASSMYFLRTKLRISNEK